jgi:RNA recognition motif-containing protein
MLSTKLFVGPLDYSLDAEKLRELFSQYGDLHCARVAQGEGFGFVEMSTQEGAEEAKKALHGTIVMGRILNVMKVTFLGAPVSDTGEVMTSSLAA